MGQIHHRNYLTLFNMRMSKDVLPASLPLHIHSKKSMAQTKQVTCRELAREWLFTLTKSPETTRKPPKRERIHKL